MRSIVRTLIGAIKIYTFKCFFACFISLKVNATVVNIKHRFDAAFTNQRFSATICRHHKNTGVFTIGKTQNIVANPFSINYFIAFMGVARAVIIALLISKANGFPIFKVCLFNCTFKLITPSGVHYRLAIRTKVWFKFEVYSIG
ncbi:hypothetical protein D9M68_508500 [compost metagenome]